MGFCLPVFPAFGRVIHNGCSDTACNNTPYEISPGNSVHCANLPFTYSNDTFKKGFQLCTTGGQALTTIPFQSLPDCAQPIPNG
jgi:hypothetical protein